MGAHGRVSGRRAACRVLLRALGLGLAVQLTASALVLGYPQGFFHPEFALWRWQRDHAEGRVGPEAVELLVVGDSKVVTGVRPEQFEGSAALLALGGGSALELDLALERYLQTHPAPERVLISIAAPHLEAAGSFWERTVKFRQFPAARLDALVEEADQHAGDPMADRLRSRAGRARLWLSRIGFLPLYHADLVRGGLVRRRARNADFRQRIDAQRGYFSLKRQGGAARKGMEAWREAFEPSSLLIAAFERSLRRCHEAGSEVWLVAMPISATTEAALRPLYREGVARYWQSLERRLPWLRVGPAWWALPDARPSCLR